MAVDLNGYMGMYVALVHNSGRFFTAGLVAKIFDDRSVVLHSTQSYFVCERMNLDAVVKDYVNDSTSKKNACVIDPKEYSLVQGISDLVRDR